MGRVNFDSLERISSIDVVRYFPKITNPINAICNEFQVGKQTKTIFKMKEYFTTSPLELVHIYLCGPTRTRSSCGDRYFMLLINDYYRMAWARFIKEKLEALDKFKAFKVMDENEINLKIKCLRSDRGGEFTSNYFNIFCEYHGIRRHLLARRTLQYNGVVERKNITIQQATRTMMKEANLSYVYWREEIHNEVYILNKGQERVNNSKIPYELWYGKPHTMKYFKFFGNKCYIRRDEDNL